MCRQFLDFSAVALRWLAIALLLAIPVGSGIVGLGSPDVRVFGQFVVGETSLNYVVENGEITFVYSRGWAGTPPRRGELCDLPGLNITRNVVAVIGQAHGQVTFDIVVRWWLLLLANLPPILLAVYLARPFLRRRHAPGRCPVCGYDLRATPDRCPECGTAPDVSR